MGKKYRKYKNFLEKFLDSSSGKRFFNIAYSVGAAIVIVGAMAKILHWRFGDALLMIGMITEAIVFLISAFEKPDKEYKWEEVYPALADNEDFIPRAQREPQEIQSATPQSTSGGPAIQSTSVPSGTSSGATSTVSNTGGSGYAGGGSSGSGSGGSTVVIGGGTGSQGSGTGNLQQPLSTSSGSSAPSGNVTIIGGGAGGSGSHTGGSIDISDNDVAQLAQMTDNMEKFAKATESLGKIADSLQAFIGSSNGIEGNTQGYVAQLEALNRNIAGLNTIYEVQLKGISGQIHTIEHINAGLERIKRLYDGSLADSSIFKNETEKMAQQLSELNRVYARLLQAMTTNMNMGGGFNPNIGGNTPTQP
ncbi:MAG: gliding motility protein GldL [Dysgonomonas sp.]|nr:gliding motility protein GldL [Dysgonomonas sp.]